MAESLLQRWFPHPFVSVIVAMSWVMLAHNMEAGTLLMAIFLAILIPRMVALSLITRRISGGSRRCACFGSLFGTSLSQTLSSDSGAGTDQNLHPKWFRYRWIPNMKK